MAAPTESIELPCETPESGVDGRGPEVVVGRLVGFIDPHAPLVTYDGQTTSAAIAARSTVDLQPEHIGYEVTLLFERRDRLKPIITGRIRKPASVSVSTVVPHVEVEADGRRLTIEASDALVLRCGKASITLTAAGKVLVQGTYVSSRSSGVIRIKGGSVQIN